METALDVDRPALVRQSAKLSSQSICSYYLVPIIVVHGIEITKVRHLGPSLIDVLAGLPLNLGEYLTAFEMMMSKPPSCSIAACTALIQSCFFPASCHIYIVSKTIKPPALQSTYTLDDNCFHVVFACNVRSDLLCDFLVVHVINCNIASLRGKLLG